MAQGDAVLRHNYSAEIHAEKRCLALRNSDFFSSPQSHSFCSGVKLHQLKCAITHYLAQHLGSFKGTFTGSRSNFY